MEANNDHEINLKIDKVIFLISLKFFCCKIINFIN